MSNPSSPLSAQELDINSSCSDSENIYTSDKSSPPVSSTKSTDGEREDSSPDNTPVKRIRRSRSDTDFFGVSRATVRRRLNETADTNNEADCTTTSDKPNNQCPDTQDQEMEEFPNAPGEQQAFIVCHSASSEDSDSDSSSGGSSSSGSEIIYVMNETSEVESIHIDRSNLEVDSSSSDNDEANSSASNLANEGSDTNCNLLYKDSPMTTDEAVLSVLNLYIEEHWTKTSLVNTLKTFKKMLPHPNELPTSLHKLLKYVESCGPSAQETKHFYCSVCQVKKDNEDQKCSSCNSEGTGVFFQFSVSDQLRVMFEYQGLADKLDHNSFAQMLDSDFISDIYSGTEYRRVKQHLTGQYDLIFIMNYDGISISKSSRLQLWPILCTICELPVNFRSDFIIVAGVYCDYKQPILNNVILRPFVQEICNINESGGVKWTHPVSKKKVQSLVAVPAISADAPAREKLFNVMEYSARFGCNGCEQKTEKVVTEGERTVRRFLYKEEPSKLRSGKRMELQGALAEERNKSRKGVKGNTVLSKMPLMDIGTSPWYIGDSIDDVCNFLKDVQVPDFVKRLARSLKDVKFWKASEYRSWLLFYSLPALRKYMPKSKERYFQHWVLLVSASFILLKSTISKSELQRAHLMLKLFVRDIGSLYTEKCYTYNVHQLLHMCLSVERWGPLWVTSTFIFESYNGVLCDLIHCSNKVGQELVNNIKLAQGVQILNSSVESRRTNCLPESLPKGNFKIKILLPDERDLVTKAIQTSEYTVHGRVRNGRAVYTSVQYDKNKKRWNSLVQFNTASSDIAYGEIRAFVGTGTQPKKIYCLIRQYSVEHNNVIFHLETMQKVNHLVPVKQTSKLVICPLDKIITKVLRVGSFVCLRPNMFEVNL